MFLIIRTEGRELSSDLGEIENSQLVKLMLADYSGQSKAESAIHRQLGDLMNQLAPEADSTDVDAYS